eukprot:CAMPEP_0170061126 /NCGR_PEP_ID=MMETSP0019_2-20121128/2815_1 /TAXON_ID=98059 /ORGANISM="Dinobryon sp., Strain UTEXLB2267" /LENGTH=194 /DNA_ID=CAMNT_0010266887 /DNA_START=2246 /DNA_END=2830 /DNA_ORIENTATION=-
MLSECVGSVRVNGSQEAVKDRRALQVIVGGDVTQPQLLPLMDDGVGGGVDPEGPVRSRPSRGTVDGIPAAQQHVPERVLLVEVLEVLAGQEEVPPLPQEGLGRPGPQKERPRTGHVVPPGVVVEEDQGGLGHPPVAIRHAAANSAILRGIQQGGASGGQLLLYGDVEVQRGHRGVRVQVPDVLIPVSDRVHYMP